MTITIGDFTGIYLLIISFTFKGYNITVIPLHPSQTISGCQHTANHCEVSSDVLSFNINCLKYNVNYSIEIYLVNYGDERGRETIGLVST